MIESVRRILHSHRFVKAHQATPLWPLKFLVYLSIQACHRLEDRIDLQPAAGFSDYISSYVMCMY